MDFLLFTKVGLCLSSLINITIGSIYSIIISHDNRFVVSGSKDQSIKILDLQEKKEIHHFQNVHNGIISP